MMAWKCDRCGEFYTEQTMSDYNIIDVNRGCLDLCPDCTADLELFVNINGGDEIAETNI